MQRGLFDTCGLSCLLHMPDIHLNHGLLTTLVEWFHLEHNTFYLSTREMTITFEDIYKILRVLFVGGRVDYDSTPQIGTLALQIVFHDGTIISRSPTSCISWFICMSK